MLAQSVIRTGNIFSFKKSLWGNPIQKSVILNFVSQYKITSCKNDRLITNQKHIKSKYKTIYMIETDKIAKKYQDIG